MLKVFANSRKIFLHFGLVRDIADVLMLKQTLCFCYASWTAARSIRSRQTTSLQSCCLSACNWWLKRWSVREKIQHWRELMLKANGIGISELSIYRLLTEQTRIPVQIPFESRIAQFSSFFMCKYEIMALRMPLCRI